MHFVQFYEPIHTTFYWLPAKGNNRPIYDSYIDVHGHHIQYWQLPWEFILPLNALHIHWRKLKMPFVWLYCGKAELSFDALKSEIGCSREQFKLINGTEIQNKWSIYGGNVNFSWNECVEVNSDLFNNHVVFVCL